MTVPKQQKQQRPASLGSSNAAPIPVQPVPKLLLTVEEAAAALGIKRWKMNLMVQSGEVRSLKVGRLRRIPMWALEAYTRQGMSE